MYIHSFVFSELGVSKRQLRLSVCPSVWLSY